MNQLQWEKLLCKNRQRSSNKFIGKPDIHSVIVRNEFEADQGLD